jgi:hypothetical protein
MRRLLSAAHRLGGSLENSSTSAVRLPVLSLPVVNERITKTSNIVTIITPRIAPPNCNLGSTGMYVSDLSTIENPTTAPKHDKTIVRSKRDVGILAEHVMSHSGGEKAEAIS